MFVYLLDITTQILDTSLIRYACTFFCPILYPYFAPNICLQVLEQESHYKQLSCRYSFYLNIIKNIGRKVSNIFIYISLYIYRHLNYVFLSSIKKNLSEKLILVTNLHKIFNTKRLLILTSTYLYKSVMGMKSIKRSIKNE